MNDFIKQLSSNLNVIKINETENNIDVYCETARKENKKVHSRVERIVKDIPYGSKKVVLHLIVKKYFNDNPESTNLTVIEEFDFLNHSRRRTKRLDEYLINLSKEMSAIGIERNIKDSYATVSDSTILRMIKKKQ